MKQQILLSWKISHYMEYSVHSLMAYTQLSPLLDVCQTNVKSYYIHLYIANEVIVMKEIYSIT